MSSQASFLGAVLSEEILKAYKQQHDESTPYTHLVLDPLYDRELMIKVQAEAKNNLSANFKETDLFKVYQTGELGFCISMFQLKSNANPTVTFGKLSSYNL